MNSPKAPATASKSLTLELPPGPLSFSVIDNGSRQCVVRNVKPNPAIRCVSSGHRGCRNDPIDIDEPPILPGDVLYSLDGMVCQSTSVWLKMLAATQTKLKRRLVILRKMAPSAIVAASTTETAQESRALGGDSDFVRAARQLREANAAKDEAERQAAAFAAKVAQAELAAREAVAAKKEADRQIAEANKAKATAEKLRCRELVASAARNARVQQQIQEAAAAKKEADRKLTEANEAKATAEKLRSREVAASAAREARAQQQIQELAAAKEVAERLAAASAAESQQRQRMIREATAAKEEAEKMAAASAAKAAELERANKEAASSTSREAELEKLLEQRIETEIDDIKFREEKFREQLIHLGNRKHALQQTLLPETETESKRSRFQEKLFEDTAKPAASGNGRHEAEAAPCVICYCNSAVQAVVPCGHVCACVSYIPSVFILPYPTVMNH